MNFPNSVYCSDSGGINTCNDCEISYQRRWKHVKTVRYDYGVEIRSMSYFGAKQMGFPPYLNTQSFLQMSWLSMMRTSHGTSQGKWHSWMNCPKTVTTHWEYQVRLVFFGYALLSHSISYFHFFSSTFNLSFFTWTLSFCLRCFSNSPHNSLSYTSPHWNILPWIMFWSINWITPKSLTLNSTNEVIFLLDIINTVFPFLQGIPTLLNLHIIDMIVNLITGHNFQLLWTNPCLLPLTC